MKKIALLIISLFYSFIIYNWVQADEVEKKLYKDTILSTTKIKNDYANGSVLVDKIGKIFMKYRYNQDRATVKNLQNLVKKNIDKLTAKETLTVDEKKKLNLFKNIYFRTVLLLDYQLK